MTLRAKTIRAERAFRALQRQVHTARAREHALDLRPAGRPRADEDGALRVGVGEEQRVRDRLALVLLLGFSLNIVVDILTYYIFWLEFSLNTVAYILTYYIFWF